MHDSRLTPLYTCAEWTDTQHPWYEYTTHHTATTSGTSIVHGFVVRDESFCTHSPMARLEVLIYLLIAEDSDREIVWLDYGEGSWTFENFESQMRALVCSDWNKCDIHGEWSMDHDTSYNDDNLKAAVAAMWQLPFPKSLLLFTIRVGCPQRDESVRMSNEFCTHVQRCVDALRTRASEVHTVRTQYCDAAIKVRDLATLTMTYIEPSPDDMLLGGQEANALLLADTLRRWLRGHRRWWISSQQVWAPSAATRTEQGLMRTVDDDCLLDYKQHRKQCDDPLIDMLERTGDTVESLQSISKHLIGHTALFMWARSGDMACALRLLATSAACTPTTVHISQYAPQDHWPFITFDTVNTTCNAMQALTQHATTVTLLATDNAYASFPAFCAFVRHPKAIHVRYCLVLRHIRDLIRTQQQVAHHLPSDWTCTHTWPTPQGTHVWLLFARSLA
jgi:hypothetical protein